MAAGKKSGKFSYHEIRLPASGIFPLFFGGITTESVGRQPTSVGAQTGNVLNSILNPRRY
uniref:Uncharacterized protein n=1 Tax=Leptospira ellisii TaxID=2023197 RepID=A0A2N0BD51_9LEPT|nr:hypothetical protein CH379_02545 [Leptospira ellisii]